MPWAAEYGSGTAQTDVQGTARQHAVAYPVVTLLAGWDAMAASLPLITVCGMK
jgi:hypothetical protein